MNELYSIDELAMARHKSQLCQEIEDRILAGDIVESNGFSYCLDSAFKELGDSFARKTLSNLLDSQNPASESTKQVVKSLVKNYAQGLAKDFKLAF